MTQHMVNFCKKFHTCLKRMCIQLLNVSGILCLTSCSYPAPTPHKILVLWSPYPEKARNPWAMAQVLLPSSASTWPIGNQFILAIPTQWQQSMFLGCGFFSPSCHWQLYKPFSLKLLQAKSRFLFPGDILQALKTWSSHFILVAALEWVSDFLQRSEHTAGGMPAFPFKYISNVFQCISWIPIHLVSNREGNLPSLQLSVERIHFTSALTKLTTHNLGILFQQIPV